MGLREQKRIQARAAIANAAVELFSERGFDATTVAAIAERAGVSRRTFFRYFTHKDATAFADQESHLRTLSTRLIVLRAREVGFPVLREAMLTMLSEIERTRTQRALWQRVIDASPALSAFERQADANVENAIASAFLTEESGPAETRRVRVLAASTAAVLRVILREWFAGECRADLIELAAEALRHLEYGWGRTSTMGSKRDVSAP